MKYTSLERSSDSGKPIELYKFVYGSTVYRYALIDGTDAPFSYLGEDYTPYTLNRASAELTEVMSRNTLNIEVPSICDVAQLFVSAPPEEIISVTIFRVHVNQSYPLQGITVFKGRIVSCEFKGYQATLNCEPIFSRLKIPGLRMVYDVMCPYALYSTGCGADKATFSRTATATAIDSRNILLTISTGDTILPDWLESGILKGGLFACGSVKRMIVDTPATGKLTLMHPIYGSIKHQSCTVSLGCEHTLTECKTKFNNVANYGGFPWIPDKNPYSDNVVWG